MMPSARWHMVRERGGQTAAGRTRYADLGVRPLINAAGRYTKFGGSVMPRAVLEAMTDAAACHVELSALQQAVGTRLAALTRNEGAYVTVGAAAGIVLGVLACTTGADEAAIRRVGEGRHQTREVIVQRGHHVPYLPAIVLAGADIVEVGTMMNTEAADLEGAITDETVAALHVAGAHLRKGTLGLDEVVAVAGRHRLPVIVDAAAQLPPVTNLWHFTRDQGAALALFSGGKDLCGPQASGLMVGRADLIEAVRAHGSPNQRLARAMKTGKEEMMGLLAAVECYLATDHEQRASAWETTLERWHAALDGLPGVRIARDPLNEAGQPIPRLLVSWGDGPDTGHLVTALLAGEPSVAVAPAGDRTIGITPETVSIDEADLVPPAVRAALKGVSR